MSGAAQGSDHVVIYRDDAAITGIGLVTPAGLGRSTNWATVCAGRTTVRRLPRLAGAPVDFACVVPDEVFNPDRLVGRRVSTRYDRCSHLALVAARAAVSDAGLCPSTWDGTRVGVILGTGAGGIATFEDNHARLLRTGPLSVSATFLPKALVGMVSGVLSIELGAKGPSLVVSTACASGATSIGLGLSLLRAGTCDIVLCGGSEAGVTSLNMAGFAKLHALSRGQAHPPERSSRPFDAGHDGFVMAEGAAVLVLERASDARARGTRVWARVAGYGASADAHHATAPDPQGAGAATAMLTACADAGLSPGEIGHVNAHATSTPLGDAVEAGVLTRTVPQAVITSTKGVTGHALGAAGAIEAAYTALSLYHQLVPPTANLCRPIPEAADLDLVAGKARPRRFDAALSTSFGFGGHNAVLALTT